MPEVLVQELKPPEAGKANVGAGREPSTTLSDVGNNIVQSPAKTIKKSPTPHRAPHVHKHQGKSAPKEMLISPFSGPGVVHGHLVESPNGMVNAYHTENPDTVLGDKVNQMKLQVLNMQKGRPGILPPPPPPRHWNWEWADVQGTKPTIKHVDQDLRMLNSPIPTGATPLTAKELTLPPPFKKWEGPDQLPGKKQKKQKKGKK